MFSGDRRYGASGLKKIDRTAVSDYDEGKRKDDLYDFSEYRLCCGERIGNAGLVNGSTIQSKNIGRDLGAGLKSIVGGELKAYTEMMEEARKIALQRLIENAENMGADAVVNIRYSTSAIMAGAAEVMIYGTAVKFK